jgi:glycosyltransferase involved in cell wall biosynthesis
MTTKSPRIAFYGGMANNCYLVAKQMRDCGLDVVFIRDHLDQYAISQPLWEDVPLTLTHQELADSPYWSKEKWDDLASELGWKAPEWLVEPTTYPDKAEPDRTNLEDDAELMLYQAAPSDHYQNIIAIMQSCDLVFVSNYYPIITAILSGKPFVICPAGGELMMASGLITGEGAVGATLEHQRRLMIKGFELAEAVITNTPFWQHRSLTNGFWNLAKIFGKCRFVRGSLPFTATPMLTKPEKTKLLRDMTDRLGLAPVDTEFCIFVPSRVDYRWKGQDRIAQALIDHPDRDIFTLIVAGWGDDYEHFRSSMASAANIRVLDFTLSKPLLRDIYRASDIVIDQLTLGHIGSAAREAAAVGTPVMARIDGLPKLPFLRPNMPVLNAVTASDVARWLSRIAAGKVDLQQHGNRAQNWILSHSSPALMKKELLKVFKRISERAAPV